MVRRYIDELPTSDSENSGSDSSFGELDTEDFRIDLIDKDSHSNQQEDNNGRLLTPDLHSSERQFEELTPPGNINASVSEELNDVPDIITPPRERKRVRFNPDEKNDDYKDLNPWDFKRVVRKLYKEQLPDTYDIKNWKRPSKELVANFIEVLESNVALASTEVFEQYSQDIDSVIPQISDQDELKDKIENEVFEFIYNIKKRLKRTKFPSKIWAENLSMEYVYAKGEVIKKRYENELEHAERMERQLLREEEILNGMRESQERRVLRHKRQLRDNLTELSKHLHPALSAALANNFGLIKDTELSQKNFEQDVAIFNLRLKTDFSQTLATEYSSAEHLALPEIVQNKVLKELIQEKLASLTDSRESLE